MTKKTILSAILCFAMVLCLSVGAVFAMPTKAFATTDGKVDCTVCCGRGYIINPGCGYCSGKGI